MTETPAPPNRDRSKKEDEAHARRLEDALHNARARWAAGDIGYVALPILMLAAIGSISHGTFEKIFHHIIHLKEWSFGAIILFGACIREIVRVKTVLQGNIAERDMDFRILAYFFFVIISVLVLTLQEVSDSVGVFVGSLNVWVLDFLQFLLFIGGATSLYSVNRRAEEFSAIDNNQPLGRTPAIISRHLLLRLQSACKSLHYVRVVMANSLPDAESRPENLVRLRDNTAPDFREQVERLLTLLETDIFNLRDSKDGSPRPNTDAPSQETLTK